MTLLTVAAFFTGAATSGLAALSVVRNLNRELTAATLANRDLSRAITSLHAIPSPEEDECSSAAN